MTYFFLLIIILINATETIGFKNSKTNNSLKVLFGMSLFSTIISFPFFLFSLIKGGISIFETFNLYTLFCLIVAATFTFFNIIFWSKICKNMPMSIAEGIADVYIVFLTFFSWLFFGGRLEWYHIILMLTVVISCIVLGFFSKSETNKKYNYHKGFLFLILWIILAIPRNLIPGVISQTTINPFVYSFLLNLLTFIPAAIIMLHKKQIKESSKQIIKDPYLMILGLARTGYELIVLYLATRVNLGIIDAISVAGLILIMLYERIIMKEKINNKAYPILIIILIATTLLLIL